MRKRWLMLLILIILLASISIYFVSCSKDTIYLEKSQQELDYKDEIMNNLRIVSTDYKNRYVSSSDSEVFVNHIVSYMGSELGYDVSIQRYYVSSVDSITCNIECTKDSPSDKQIILACQWDNCYSSFDNANPDGAYESGAAIATLMAIAKELKDKDLKYDLKIVFFGCAVQSYYGSEYYFGQMSEKEKEDTLLVINLAMIGAGDNTYMYSRDFSTNYNDTFYSIAEANELGFTKVPLDKRIISSTFSNELSYDYVHIGMFGNQNIFMNNSIPTINYLSINWKDKSNPAYTEISGKDNVFETPNDTYQNMIDRVGEEVIKERLNNILKSVVLSLDEYYSFVEQDLYNPTEINSFFLSDKAYYIGTIAVKILAVAVLYIILTKMQSIIQHNKGEYLKMFSQSNNLETFESQQQEEIDPFSDTKNDNDINDDIFQ
ncbi:MAG: M28 family peptidase [Christensenella sp.]|nr:M28 family peptidase [Christensenella sp.]